LHNVNFVPHARRQTKFVLSPVKQCIHVIQSLPKKDHQSIESSDHGGGQPHGGAPMIEAMVLLLCPAIGRWLDDRRRHKSQESEALAAGEFFEQHEEVLDDDGETNGFLLSPTSRTDEGTGGSDSVVVDAVIQDMLSRTEESSFGSLVDFDDGRKVSNISRDGVRVRRGRAETVEIGGIHHHSQSPASITQLDDETEGDNVTEPELLFHLENNLSVRTSQGKYFLFVFVFSWFCGFVVRSLVTWLVGWLLASWLVG
jgi:hypothetical protein